VSYEELLRHGVGASSAKGRGSSFGRVTVVLRVNSANHWMYNWAAKELGLTSPAPHSASAASGAGQQQPPPPPQTQQRHPEVRVVPVLFNLGVNEMQSVSNAAGDTSVQSAINRSGVASLRAYHAAFLRFKQGGESGGGARAASCAGQGGKAAGQVSSGGELEALLESLAYLVEAEARKGEKLVDLLLVSCYAARLLHGARTTSCKSAKDRTSVFQTLEAVRLAERWGWVDRASEQTVLDALRGPRGVRLRNARANIGRLKYSFSPVQVRALPAELRPPLSTTQGGKA
jgi:inositol polyphosphate-4-phosphatase